MPNPSMQALKQALDAYSKADRYHQTVGFNRMTPTKLKQLALAVEPKAAVHKTPFGKYKCVIDGKAMHGCEGGHATPVQAWACLAKHLVARELTCEREQ